MREKLKRLLLFIAAASLLMSMSATPMEALAAGKTALNKTKVTLAVGNAVKLKLKNAPADKAVTWSSNKKAVASVNKNGKVKAKKAGTATITAKVDNKRYTCKVTVKEFSLSNTEGKNANHVDALKAVIQEQNAKGASLPANLDNERYTWDGSGSLTRLDWSDCGLKGDISLKGIVSLTYFDCRGNAVSNLDMSGCTRLWYLYSDQGVNITR